MKKIKKNLLPLINIFVPILLFIILLFIKLGDNVLYFIILTIIIGWSIPYFVLIITGLALFKISQPKLIFIFNLVNVILLFMLIVFIIKLYSNDLIIFLIEYIVMLIISVTNIIYLLMYMKKHPDVELENIKKIKKNNNGAVV